MSISRFSLIQGYTTQLLAYIYVPNGIFSLFDIRY